jgi:CHAT domain-containing protein
MVAIIQPNVPGCQRLPFADAEFEKIANLVPDTSNLVKLGTSMSPTSVDDVLSHLSDASIVHFACHRIQHPTRPLESALLLEKGSLKISKIMEHPMPNASLAFLSACETAMGDDSVPDEAIHVAATMLFAGFRGVVGTMWLVLKVIADKSNKLIHIQVYP